ncbi:MAG: GNAT family N-acetyltransferase [Clostridia bacterium]|nr:GNAT family N-acetyltransferase [Clostridia bacterium]
MLRLRPYKRCDAAAIVSWVGDRTAFHKWCADRFDTWPITADDLNRHYDAMADSDSFYEMTAFDAAGPAGHLILRFTDAEKTVLRFGFVIVDSARRGRGYGREMLALAVRYAFDILKAEKITIGVFENNEPAYRCYRAAGFRDVPLAEPEVFHVMGEDWNCLEMEMTRADVEN